MMKDYRNTIIVTGAAGFIGFSLIKKLIISGYFVIGIDNLNDYYDVQLKKLRLEKLNLLGVSSKNWMFIKLSIEDFINLEKIFNKYKPKIVVNLAAQAGVRYSIKNPHAYVKSNLVGFTNVIDLSAKYEVQNYIFASSSSVYGGNTKLPYNEEDNVNHPVSMYAATKRANELIAHSYSNIYQLPCTGLRFFTVYGPWGRPDMSPMIFAKSILDKLPIEIFNYGDMKRDFTYIDDIVEGIYRCCMKPAKINKFFDKNLTDAATSFAPYKIFNIGNSKSIDLMYFIELLEKNLKSKAKKRFLPKQPGEVLETLSDCDRLNKWVNFKSTISIEEGTKRFCEWFLNYYES